MRPSEELHAFGTFVFLIIHVSLQKLYTGLKCNPQSNANIHHEATILLHPLYISLALKWQCFLCRLQIKDSHSDVNAHMLSKIMRFSCGIDNNGLSDINIDFLSRLHVINPQLLVHSMEQRVNKTIPALQSSTHPSRQVIWQLRSLFLLCNTKLASCSILYWLRRRQGAAEGCVLQIDAKIRWNHFWA